MVHDKSTVPAEGVEYRHGITPPMRDVRSRLFKSMDLPEPATMRRLANDLIAISGVGLQALASMSYQPAAAASEEHKPLASSGKGYTCETANLYFSSTYILLPICSTPKTWTCAPSGCNAHQYHEPVVHLHHSLECLNSSVVHL